MVKKTKLIQLLETFSGEEFTNFGKFINSPFHNESPKMRTMYSFLKKHYPAFDHKDCSKENIFHILYPEKTKYDDTKLRERFSDMLKLAEDYTAYIQIKQNVVEFKRQALYQFSARRLDVHFDKKSKEITAILDKTIVKDLNYFLYVFSNEADRNSFYEYRKLSGKRKNYNDEMVHEVDTFLSYFAAFMTSYYVTMYNMEDTMNCKFEYKFYEPVMKFIEENDLTAYPLIKANYLLLKIKENEDDVDLYYQLKETYIKDMEQFAEQDKTRIGTLLVNDALRRSKEGKTTFNTERFEIMKLQFENETYTKENNCLSREQYLNFVMTCVSLGEISFAEKFIADFTIKLDPNRQKHAYLYAKSLIHCHKKEYKPALKALAEIKGGDYNYFVLIKSLCTKIYFEMDDYENVLSVIDSFKHYLSSNTSVPEFMRKRYTNYIRIMNKLTLLKVDYDEFKKQKLIEEIKSFSINDLTQGKQWLLEKALELKAS